MVTPVPLARYMWPLASRSQRLVMGNLLLTSGWGLDINGRELARASGVTFRSALVTLARLEDLGWAESEYQGRGDGSPAQRVYRLTDSGCRRVMERTGLMPLLLAREEAA